MARRPDGGDLETSRRVARDGNDLLRIAPFLPESDSGVNILKRSDSFRRMKIIIYSHFQQF
jgi:hypothetical protein